MPLFVAFVKAELEGVASLAPPEDVTWKIDVKHSSGDEVRSGVTICASDEVELTGSKGVANLVLKFADASEQSNCSVVTAFNRDKKKGKKKGGGKGGDDEPRAVTADDSGEWVPIVAFEARGLEVVNLTLGTGDLVVTAEGGRAWDDADLSDDWAEYDEENEVSVSVMSIETKVEAVR